jgi:hypothetical protein
MLDLLYKYIERELDYCENICISCSSTYDSNFIVTRPKFKISFSLNSSYQNIEGYILSIYFGFLKISNNNSILANSAMDQITYGQFNFYRSDGREDIAHFFVPVKSNRRFYLKGQNHESSLFSFRLFSNLS